MNTPTVEKILSVEDTRSYEEVGDTFKPVSGSGILNSCKRCGKLHEIHAQVKMSNGEVWTVGTSCMAVGNKELAARFRSAESAAKKIAALTAKKARAVAYATKYRATREELTALGFPETTTGEVAYPGTNSKSLRARMGDASVCYYPQSGTACFQSGGFDAERAQCLRSSYLDNRMAERGFRRHPATNGELADIDRDIRKAEARLQAA